MTQVSFAARSHIRNVVLCALATLTLAACGSEDGSSSAAAVSTTSSDTTVASTNVGMIDRSAGIDTSETGASNAAAVSDSTTGANSAAGSASVATTGTGASSGTATAGAGTGTNSGTTTAGTGTATAGAGKTASTGNKTTLPVKSTTTSGVATLDWIPPTENTDGSVLTDLAGYTVYYGTSPDNLSQSIKVTNPGLSAYTVSDLTSGTWYFAVTSYSSSGVESTRTGTLSTTI